MDCDKSCGSCGGCGAGSIFLTAGALALLDELGREAFLPLICRDGREVAVTDAGLSSPAAVKALKINGLATADRDIPLANFPYDDYPDSPWRGSMALTKRGQEALDSISVLGVEE